MLYSLYLLASEDPIGNVGLLSSHLSIERHMQHRKTHADTSEIDADTFHVDVQYIESLWKRTAMGALDMPLIDESSDKGNPLVFVPILEHLEFVYARQIRAFSQIRRVIMYRRHESRTQPADLVERAKELRQVLDALGLECVDLVGHGDAAMVLFEFAVRYPQRCRSLTIVAQGADYQIAPHPFIWLLHELFLRLPVEYILPAWFLRRIVINYIVARNPTATPLVPARGSPAINRGPTPSLSSTLPSPDAINRVPTPLAGTRLPRILIEEQFGKIALWPFVYKFSVLPIIHYYDMRNRLASLTMPVLLINRADDVLSPEAKTQWLAEHLPNCAGHHIVPGGERFFMYAEAETVNQLIEQFLASAHAPASN